MAEKTQDKRRAVVKVTKQEMAQLLGSQARQASLIDFVPDVVEVHDNGDSFDIYFIRDLESVPA